MTSYLGTSRMYSTQSNSNIQVDKQSDSETSTISVGIKDEGKKLASLMQKTIEKESSRAPSIQKERGLVKLPDEYNFIEQNQKNAKFTPRKMDLPKRSSQLSSIIETPAPHIRSQYEEFLKTEQQIISEHDDKIKELVTKLGGLFEED